MQQVLERQRSLRQEVFEAFEASAYCATYSNAKTEWEDG